MAPRTVYWKLGLFFVVGLVCVVLGLSLFGSRALGQKTVDYETYFDESVGGLGVGAPVRFRGITIGRVGRIGLAPDRRHVAVTFALGVGHLRRLGLATDNGPQAGLALQPDMRAQLASNGLTGPPILSIDYFDPATHPPPELPFPVPARTIPSTRSTLSEIEDSLTTAAERLPDLVDRASRLLAAGNDLVTQLDDARLGDRTSETLHSVDDVLSLLRSELARLNTKRIPEQIGRAVATLDSALSRLDSILSSAESEHGLVTSAQRATDALGDAARGSGEVGHQLSATLQEVRQTAATIRRLADALDRTPDMLVKGRPKGVP
jgi:ABC-type transporter Mla subunit MlaD